MWRYSGCVAVDNMSSPANISVLVLDVDGVLTDGTISFEPKTRIENKTFHVHDGLGLSLWQKVGNHVILISGRNAPCVTQRAAELGIKYVHQGSKDKIADLCTTLDTLGATAQQTCFVGDDLGDLAAMDYAGYSVAVHNAVQEVKEAADWITSIDGGHGAVREVVEHLMHAAGTWTKAIATCNEVSLKQ
jgi:3-deoxy-D-manno-octulosonate 8-phosphate phosphatase (KDO 8-P phosphatase)